MTREELAKHDGREGRRAYAAVNGKIYDFTDSPLWRTGDHQGLHRAGADLSSALNSAPHVRAVIERFPVVGDLQEPAPADKAAGGLWKVAAILLVAAAAVALLLLR